MEDLSCSNSFTTHFIIHHPSPSKFHQSQSHCQFLTASSIQQSIRLRSQPKCWFTRPRERVRSLAFSIRTDYNNASKAKQDGGVDDEAIEEALTTSNAQFSFINDAQHDYGHEGNANIEASKMLASVSEILSLGNHSNTHNVHVHNDYTHTRSSETMQTQNEERLLKRKNQQLTYLFAALASSAAITSVAGLSVYYRFAWQMEGGEVPWTEMFGTFSLALGAAVGMEYWARWAHRALWHTSLWNMHESHHRPRDGPFELNDIFAIINAIPAIALMAFGFLHKGLVPGLCFGAGLGITVFGIAYMFVHDGLVHRRFPVGPIADVPYFQKVAAAHQLHHADTFNGVPYGLFLGPMELEEVGGRTALERLLQKRKREKTNPIKG